MLIQRHVKAAIGHVNRLTAWLLQGEPEAPSNDTITSQIYPGDDELTGADLVFRVADVSAKI